MITKCPQFVRTAVIADDPFLAGELSSVFARPGEYLAVIDGPRLSRPDGDAEIIRRNNAIARIQPRRIFFAGLSDQSANQLLATIRLKEINRISTSAEIDGLRSKEISSSTPLHWGRERVGIGLLQALRTRRRIIFSDIVSPDLDLSSKKGHLVVCEEGENLSQIIAANYAYSLGAGLSLIPKVSREQSDALLERFYSLYEDRETAPTQILDELGITLRGLCASINVPDQGSITFITRGLPYGFAFAEIPTTHLFIYPDLGISVANGFSAEQASSKGIGVAAFINPETVEAPEIETSIRLLTPRRVLSRSYCGPAASVRMVSEVIEHFPYDFLMIATHCGDSSGYRWTYEFTDSEGLFRTLVVDIAIGISRTSEKKMFRVMQFTNFVSLDGVDWHDPKKSEKIYVGKAIIDFVHRTRENGDLKPIKKETVRRVVWSSALKMFDNNYIAVPRPLAGNGTPIIINNACGSWHRLAATFTFGNARAYVGTLFPISTTEAQVVVARLIEKHFQKPLAAALWASQKQVYGNDARRPYVVTGVYPQWLRTKFRDVPLEALEKLRKARNDWGLFLEDAQRTNSSSVRELKEIVDFHDKEIKHFVNVTKTS